MRLFFLLAMLCLPVSAAAGEFRSALSLQGYTGLLNTPNAEVTPQGGMELLYSDQVEPMWRDVVDDQENYLFSIGILPWVEGGLRLTEAPGRARDLSANFKLQIPLPHSPWVPRFALGIQDVAGGAPNLRTYYAVASHEVWRLRLSAGYGLGPDRLEGFFGGAEMRLTDWLYLIAENDAEETAAGVRLLTPEELLPLPVEFGATAKMSLEREEEIDLAFSFRFPLGHDDARLACPPSPLGKMSAPEELTRDAPDSLPPSTAPGGAAAPEAPLLGTPLSTELSELQARLAEMGFENVRVGRMGASTFYVELENGIFNHNELDGIGVALGAALAALPPGFDRFHCVLKNENLPVFYLAGPTEPFRRFFLRPAGECIPPADLQRLRSLLQAGNAPPGRPSELVLVHEAANPSFLHSDLLLSPGLATAVGTDYGVFDYRLSLKADLFVHLWTGATANARWDIPVSWSDDYEEGGRLNSEDNDATFERLFLNQAFRLAPGLFNLTGAGMYLEDVLGVLNETLWEPEPGTHRLRMRLGRFDEESQNARNVFLGSYRYYFQPLDLFIEGTAGRFYNGDEGYQLEIKRFFGDASISAVYTDTSEEIAAFRISFPLTPRRDMKPGLLRLRGADRWAYEISTVLAEEGDRNPLIVGLGGIPQTTHNLERTFFNTDRLNRGYLQKHLGRLRDAYRRFVSSVPEP